ncbi:hypothetical protein QMZ05_21545, partial [Bradyrhizobium sp. INPA03-11B]
GDLPPQRRQHPIHRAPLKDFFNSLLERFPATWTPVRVKKTRPNWNLEPRSDSIGTGLCQMVE